MSRNHVSLVKDPVHGSIDLTLFEKRILGHHLVDRMQNIKQLSLVYRVFPGATHTRLIHSLGTMHVAWQIFKYAIANADAKDRKAYLKSLRHRLSKFLTGIKSDKEFEELVRLWVSDSLRKQDNQDTQEKHSTILDITSKITDELEKLGRAISTDGRDKRAYSLLRRYCKLLYSDFIGPYFGGYNYSCNDSYRSENIQEYALADEFAFTLVIQSLRIKALLHDVGHLPYSHILEFAFSGGSTNTNLVHSSALHERISYSVVVSLLFDIMLGMQRGTKNNSDRLFKSSLAIALLGITHYFSEKHMFPEIYKSIISANGSVDADRIDYVLRDGLHTGMLQSSGDYERIYKTFILIKISNKDDNLEIIKNAWKDVYDQIPYYTNKNEMFMILPTIHGLNDVSQILVDRYRLAKNVNNHHRVRRLDGLLQEIVELLITINHHNMMDNRKLNIHSNDEADQKEINKYIRIIRNISKELSHKEQLINTLASSLENNDISTSLASSLKFSEFTDDWVISRFRELHTALKSIDRMSENHAQLSPPNVPGKLLAYLEEIFSRRSFVSLWKRETDFINTLHATVEDEDYSRKYCKIWIIVKILVSEYPKAWKALSEEVERELLLEYSNTINAVFLSRNTAKPSVTINKPLYLTELAVSGSKFLLYRGEFLQPSIRGIAQGILIDIPFYAYVLPKSKDTKLNKEDIAKTLLKRALAFYDNYIKVAGEEIKDKLISGVDNCCEQLSSDMGNIAAWLGEKYSKTEIETSVKKGR